MERLARLGKANAEGIDMVREAVGLSKHDLMSLGLDADQADGLLRLAGVYFPISRTKEAAVAAARANGHNWKALLVIEGYVR